MIEIVWQDIVGDPKEWTDKYSGDATDPTNLIERLSVQGSPTELGVVEVYEIARTKSRRRASLVKHNDDGLVRALTRIALDTDLTMSEQVRISILTALHGVRIPTASAILSWSKPNVWPVIDRRAWAALADLGLVDAGRASRLSAVDWEEYCRIVLPAAASLNWTPQKFDRWLYGYARDRGLGATP